MEIIDKFKNSPKRKKEGKSKFTNNSEISSISQQEIQISHVNQVNLNIPQSPKSDDEFNQNNFFGEKMRCLDSFDYLD